jgi:asparagine synthase (glutamine-hydrolysing)
MLNGLEVRAPFLDYKLVAWASGLPHQYKMKGLTTKYILKKLMENKVPRDIVWRKKQGFAMPSGCFKFNGLFCFRMNQPIKSF